MTDSKDLEMMLNMAEALESRARDLRNMAEQASNALEHGAARDRNCALDVARFEAYYMREAMQGVEAMWHDYAPTQKGVSYQRDADFPDARPGSAVPYLVVGETRDGVPVNWFPYYYD